MPTPLELMTTFYSSNPTLIDPKFNGDAAKAAESHLNLQAAYTQATQKLAAQNPTPTPTPTPGLNIPDPPKTDLWSDLRAELTATGVVSEGLKAKFKAAGIPEDMINSFSDASRITQETRINMAKQMLGGDAEYAATIAYAQTLPPSERESINKALQSDAWQVVLQGLNQRRIASRATNEPNRQILPSHGSPAAPASGIHIDSFESLCVALRDPRCAYDTEYRKSIETAVAKKYGRKA